MRILLVLLLCAGQVFADTLPETLDIRAEGFYLSPREQRGRVTTVDPLGALDAGEIRKFMFTHPELQDHRVVIGLPSLLGGRQILRDIKAALTELNLPTDVEVIRWPNGTLQENLLDFLPRRQDWQPPIKPEITRGHVMVFGGEALSMSLMLYLVLTKQLSPLLGAASTLLDLSQQALLTYPIRAMSNYLRRQSFARQFLFNVIVGAVQTTSFFLLFNSADLHAVMPRFFSTVIPGTVVSAIWSNTGLTAFRWEGSPENLLPLERKRVMRSNLLLIQQIILSPFYIYSVSPFAKKIFELSVFRHDLMEVNLGHLVILGAGVGAAAAYPMMDSLARWTSKLAGKPGVLGKCVRLLSKGRS